MSRALCLCVAVAAALAQPGPITDPRDGRSYSVVTIAGMTWLAANLSFDAPGSSCPEGPKACGPFRGAYSANGAVGQWIAVFPALELVIAHKTHNIYGRSTSTASWQRIIELLFEAKGVKMTEPYPWAVRATQAP
jgi:hypothetical protein